MLFTNYIERSLLLIISLLLFSFTNAQESDSLRNVAPKVFIDCNFCDEDYIRQNVTFVNYVRDRMLADIHVLVTMQETGSGGNEFTLTFIGQKKFLNKNDTLLFTSKAYNTGDEIRAMGNQYLMMGLIPYISKTPIAKLITITHEEQEDLNAVEDKWNNWVFTLDFNGYFRGQETVKSNNIWTSIEAVRITPEWKLEVELEYDQGKSTYTLEDETVTGITSGRYADFLLVKSINKHWSIGGFSEINSSFFENMKMGIEISPALEYNLFPYSESTRKQLRFLYTLDGMYNVYNDTTIYNKAEEKLYGQSMAIALALIQPWGSINTSIEGSHYFHDISLNRLSLFSNLNFRLFKGLSLNMYGRINLIHDQINLPKAGASDEDVLLMQKQLATQYSYWGSIGLSYTFGSIYNNIVNPRFGN